MTKADVSTAVNRQYEAYPYPPRDPKDEAKRLIVGSPSHPHEIDTHIYGGKRDWSKPFRVLVAGGGTGDALVQMAQVLATAKAPYEITYLDLSQAARDIAEARIAARGLGGVTFHTASLLDAASYGVFDYIDCCGVLHHLPDPQSGLKALVSALAPGGGIGFMVYARKGRAGVYPLQQALSALVPPGPPEERLAAAKKLLAKVPKGHAFRRNANLGDHFRSEAGLYDLLLHAQDRAYAVDEWLEELDAAGLVLTQWATPALYDLALIADPPNALSVREAMALTEKMRGTITKHVGYAQRAGEARAPIKSPSLGLVPHLQGQRSDMVKAIAAGRALKSTVQGASFRLKLPEAAAGLLRRVDGRASLAEIAASGKLDAVGFQALWGRIHTALMATGTLRYSGLRAR